MPGGRTPPATEPIQLSLLASHSEETKPLANQTTLGHSTSAKGSKGWTSVARLGRKNGGRERRLEVGWTDGWKAKGVGGSDGEEKGTSLLRDKSIMSTLPF